MTEYNLDVTVDGLPTTEDIVDDIIDRLASFGVAVGNDDYRRIVITITIDSTSIARASQAGIALVEQALAEIGGEIVGALVLPTSEFDVNVGITSRPAMLSVSETANRLGVTRQAVLQRLQRGTLRGRRVGKTWVVAAVDAANPDTTPAPVPE